jgi:site-specific recombinase XerC
MRNQRSAWNKGRLLGQKPPLKPKEIWSLRIRLQLADKTRDLALFNLALDSKLRGCDLVSLRVRDVYQGSVVSSRAIVMQRKTRSPVQFEITEAAREAIAAWVAQSDLRSTSSIPRPRRGTSLVRTAIQQPGIDSCFLG